MYIEALSSILVIQLKIWVSVYYFCTVCYLCRLVYLGVLICVCESVIPVHTPQHPPHLSMHKSRKTRRREREMQDSIVTFGFSFLGRVQTITHVVPILSLRFDF